jgi:hypothetical protein
VNLWHTQFEPASWRSPVQGPAVTVGLAVVLLTAWALMPPAGIGLHLPRQAVTEFLFYNGINNRESCCQFLWEFHEGLGRGPSQTARGEGRIPHVRG